MAELQTLIPIPHDLPAYKALLSEFHQYPCGIDAAVLITGIWEHLQIAQLDSDDASETLAQLTDSLCSSYEQMHCDRYATENDMYAALDSYLETLCDNITIVTDYYRPYSGLVNYSEISMPTVTRVWPTVALISIDEATLCNTRHTDM